MLGVLLRLGATPVALKGISEKDTRGKCFVILCIRFLCTVSAHCGNDMAL